MSTLKAIFLRLSSWRLSAKLFLVFGILSLAFLVLAISTETALWDIDKDVATVEETSDVVGLQVVPLIRAMGEIQRSVIQVQQFLTDISATRGRDGLDTGFDEAAENADRFRRAMAEARKIAQDLRLASLVAKLDAVEEAFPPFYEMGQEMARRYIAEGPEGGNKLMGRFDATAARLDKAMEELIAEGNRFSDEQITQLRTSLDDLMVETDALSERTLILAIVGLLVAVLGAVFLRQNIARPMARMTETLEAVMGGDQARQIPYQDREDEIGAMARALKRYREMMAEQAELEAARAREEAARREQEARLERERREAEIKRQQEEARQREEARRRRRDELLALADRFERSVKSVAEHVASSSEQMRGSAREMVVHSEEVAHAADGARQATDQAANNVTVVAAAAEELSYSINTILERVKEAARVAGESTRKADQANERISHLNEAAQKIGEVIELINDIAAQTNLLALNATIEAARAGEAGKGFAVVAGEVKNLAAQTAKATEEIAGQIAAIQEATQDAVGGIAEVTEAIRSLNEIAGAISEAVEEQSAATRDISHNTQQAAAGAQEAMQTIDNVKQAADTTRGHAGQVLEAAEHLVSEAERLRQEVDGFLEQVRSEDAA